MTTYRILEKKRSFIVQQEKCIVHGFIPFWDWQNVKEFTSLEEARAYKHNLELEEGIVRE